MKTQNEKMMLPVAVGIVASLLFPQVSGATCLQGCSQGIIRNTAPSLNYQQNQSNVNQTESRRQSHDFGNDSTSVLGDMNIRIGHEKMEIKDIRSPNSVIDASITSVVNLGNANK